nr:hypothetical protein [Tanacetum cinerariifolium]
MQQTLNELMDFCTSLQRQHLEMLAKFQAQEVDVNSEVGPTASPIIRRRKGKEILVESDTPKKKKLQEQIDA